MVALPPAKFHDILDSGDEPHHLFYMNASPRSLIKPQVHFLCDDNVHYV